MNDSILTIYDKLFGQKPEKDPKEFIKTYEENKEIIEIEIISVDSIHYYELLALAGGYAIALVQYGSLKKSIPYLDKAITLFSYYSEIKAYDYKQNSMFEDLVWYRGTTNYHLKNNKSATKDFQYLVTNNPENDKYRNWLAGSKTESWNRIQNNLWIPTAICMVAFYLTEHDKNRGLNNIFALLLALFLISIAGIYLYVISVKSAIKKK